MTKLCTNRRNVVDRQWLPGRMRHRGAGPVKLKFENHQAHWMLAANLAPSVTMWVVAVQIARIYGPEPLGAFAITNAIVTPIILVMQLPMRTLHVTSATVPRDMSQMLGIRFAMLAMASLIIVGIGTQLHTDTVSFLTLLSLTVYRGCDSYCDLLHATLQREDRIRRIGSLVLVRNASVTGAALIAAQSGFGLDVLVASMAVVSLLTSAVLDTAVAQKSCKLWPARLELREWKEQVKRLAPLSALQGLNALTGNVPRYAVQWFGGSQLLGLYSVLEHLALITSTVVNAMGQSTMARLSRLWNAGNLGEFGVAAKSLLLLSVFSSGAIAMACLIFGNTIVVSVYGESFAGVQSHIYEASLVAVATSIVSALGYALTASGAFRQQIRPVAMTLLTTTLVALVSLPMLGLSGIFLAVGLAAVVQATVSGLQLVRRVRSSPHHV